MSNICFENLFCFSVDKYMFGCYNHYRINVRNKCSKGRYMKSYISNKKTLIISIFAIIFTVVILSFILLNNTAKAEDNIKISLSFETVKLSEGDTIWDYACSFCNYDYFTITEYIKRVESINEINADFVKAGDIVSFPIYTASSHTLNN